MKRVSLLGISVWDSAITVFLWQWHPLQKLWDIPRTGWISTGYPQTTCTKVISAQNDLYSLGSRLSKNALFNKLVWEPTNYETFRQLKYNASDQKNAELMAPVYRQCAKGYPGDRYTRMAGTGSHSCRHEKRCQCHS